LEDVLEKEGLTPEAAAQAVDKLESTVKETKEVLNEVVDTIKEDLKEAGLEEDKAAEVTASMIATLGDGVVTM